MSQDHLRELGTDRPQSARMYDYYLGGKTNFGPDRKGAEEALRIWPDARTAARTNRAFMHRATRTLAERGIRQFLDIGTGIPTEPNLHQVAQSVAPEARVVYVDNDPIVLPHARALLTGTPQGHTAFVEGDLTRPEEILNAAELDALDLSEPVALSLNAVLHFVTDEQDPYGTVTTLLAALPSGSALCLSHLTADIDPDTINGITDTYSKKGVPTRSRSRDQVVRFFDGLELLHPGVVLAHRWYTEEDETQGWDGPDIGAATDAAVSNWAGVAIKP